MCTNVKIGDSKSCTHNGVHVKERKTRIVMIITIVAMVLEISFGYITNSMALLSDGWHMSTHVLAIGGSWLVYKYIAFKQSKGSTSLNTSRLLALTGYTNGMALLVMAVLMLTESLQRISLTVNIDYFEASIVSVAGLAVNLISVNVLCHHDLSSDHNLKASYIHVMADVLTSFLALAALGIAYYFNWPLIDALVGILGSLIIIFWALGLIKNTWIDLVSYDDREKHKSGVSLL